MTHIRIMLKIIIGLAAACTSQLALAQDNDSKCPPYETVGEGPDLLLVPGLGSSPEVWDGIKDTLALSHRVHLVHVAGFAGRAANGPAETIIERSTQEIVSYLDCSGIAQADYAGHSMGGFLGLKLAAEHPERINRLIIVDSLPFYSLIASPQATVETARPFADQFRDQMLAQDDASYAASIRATARSLVQDPVHQETIAGWALASDPASFVGAFHNLMTSDLRSQLGSVTASATVLAAANPYAPRERIEQLYTGAYEGLADVELRIIDDSFHFIMLDQQEAFLVELQEALSRD